MESFITLSLIFAPPAGCLAYFVVSLVRFINVKVKRGSGELPDSFGSQLKNRRTHLIISSILLGVILTVYVCGFIMLVMAIAHM